MSRRNFLPWLFTIIFCLFGLSLLLIVLLPFGTMKTLLNVLSRDGNLSLLRMDNAIVFRFLIGAFGLSLLGLAYLTGKHLWEMVIRFIRQMWRDFWKFFSFSNISRSEKGYLVSLSVVTILAGINRLALMESPMLHDEAYTVVTYADSFFHALTDYSMPNNHVFHTLLVNLSVRAFGLAPWSVRLPAFLAGVLVIPGVYFLAKQIYDPWTGLFASVLVAFSPSLISYSTSARGYTLVALFTLVIIILGIYVRKEKNLVAWGLIAIFSALGLYTVPVMLFPFGMLFVWLFLENLAASPAPYSSKWEFIRYWLIAGFLTAFLTILLYAPVLIYTGPQKLFANGFVAPLTWADLPDTWHARLIDTWAEWTHGVPLAITIMLLAGWVSSLIFHRKLANIRVPLQLAALLWITFLLIAQRSNAWAKVWVFLLPLMLIWSAAGIIGLMRSVHLKFLYGLSLASILTAVVLFVGGLSTLRLIPELRGLWSQRGDVENAVIFFKNSISDTDLIVVDWPDDASVWFYSLEYNLSNNHFDKRIPFTRAWVLVNPPDGQSIDSVLADRGPDSPALDLASIKLIHEIGTRQIYQCPVK